MLEIDAKARWGDREPSSLEESSIIVKGLMNVWMMSSKGCLGSRGLGFKVFRGALKQEGPSLLTPKAVGKKLWMEDSQLK
jgi:hypothetical protein